MNIGEYYTSGAGLEVHFCLPDRAGGFQNGCRWQPDCSSTHPPYPASGH